MRAIEVKIHNFRSIYDATIGVKPYGLLVGVNNAGKSSVIDAIRACYGKGVKFNQEKDFPKRCATDEDSWVEIEFQPSPEELENLKDEYKTPGGTFRVRNYFLSGRKDEDGKALIGPYAYTNGVLSNARFYGFKTVGQAKFGDIIYIPAVSKIDEHTKLSGPSALRDLINAVLSRVIETSGAYQALHKSFEEFEGSIKTERTEDGHSLQSIEDDVSQGLQDWGANFHLNVNPVGVEDIVKSLIGHEIVDQDLGTPQPVASYGQGFQRSVIYTLIRVAAKYATKKPPAKKKEFNPDLTWILFEEPEAFLHPTQVNVLSGALRELSMQESTQVLISTHSPQFATHSVRDIPAICRLHRSGCQTSAFQISDTGLDAILSSNQRDAQAWQAAGLQIHADDLRIDMEGVKYALWLDARRCGAFFAERVLLVEGPTETALFSYMYDLGALPACRGVYILDTIGKYNIHRFMRLFEALGIWHYVLYDADMGRHAAVDASIQAASNQFTGGIDTFADDIERFIGIPHAEQKHRKPQHVLFHLNSGTVLPEKLAALAAKVQTLLSQR
ncbi:MAG: hypothetical protein CSYNP_02118 [Syntrophus sp. SKADARSKE-3]|nr:hypothetical protein [Syntrophus sp. SKADARSKE-3]